MLADGVPAHAAGIIGLPSKSKREQSVRSIPFQKMNKPTQAKLWPVVSNPSIHRQMPAEIIASDPQMFLFLIRHPEVIVNIWELMGITHVKMDRTSSYTFEASDGAGTNSKVELVYGTNNLHVLYAKGTYDGPLFKRPIQGQCVMVLQSEYRQDTKKRTFVANKFDIFLKVDHVGAELIAKTLSPLVGRAADYNFSESVKFIGKIAEAAEKNGPGVQRLASRLQKVDPTMRRKFSDLAASVYHKSVLRKSGEFQTTVGATPQLLPQQGASGNRPDATGPTGASSLRR